ncbi:Zinc (Zn2)-Iron (Fe2) Permease (ZIP) Family [Phytophthora nicotianae]|uniref:Zinc (Zn2)-Iron (Fe2) Permease (ZIP) Family n=1 Tax=Phytophthora nicotianae TaxID=4792 RepID=A0A0W8DFL0_PHYNI|nr:Zinc (Zn2)-Iron (Fe2) Permease (ZIP) Family [Phytophthora nicotianae]
MKLPCRHAIAYRKHCNASGPLIPWSGIDERWTTTAQALKKVKQFSYEKFDDEGEGGPKKKLRTHSSEQEVPSVLRRRKLMDTESSVSHDKFQKKQVTIRLNPKAKKVGRPQKKKKATSAGEKKDRKWYEAIEEGRKTAGEVTLSALLNSLDREQPGLVETQRRLSGVLVKFEEAEKKKPKYKVLKNPVLILDPFFVRPSKLLSACIKVLPASNTQDTAISIEDSQSSKGQQRASGKEGVETVLIKDVGSFSRDQIEIFKRVQNMKAAVHSGIDMHRWLVDKGIASLPAGYHGFANQVADEVMATYPYKKIQGLPNLTDYTYVMLYTVSPPEWLTDAAIRAYAGV